MRAIGSRLAFRDWTGLATLAAGAIGNVAKDIVEGRVQLQGRMRDLMEAAVQLLPGSPVAGQSGWWAQLVRRARAAAAHSPERDARQVRFTTTSAMTSTPRG